MVIVKDMTYKEMHIRLDTKEEEHELYKLANVRERKKC